jgi:plastocyanin
MATRAERRAAAAHRSSPTDRVRLTAFAGLVLATLVAGSYLAFGDFLNRPEAPAGVIQVQSSMAGFTPSEIRVKAGSTVTLDWWTHDGALHLEGGVHTLIAPELGLYEELAAESRRMVTWQVPDRPGTFVMYCDTCCGGKESPSMWGTIVIEA